MNKLKKIYTIVLIVLIFISLYLSGFKLFHNKYLESIKALTIIPLILIPSITRKICKKNTNYLLEIIIIVFIYISFYLGWVMKYFIVVSNYDKAIHLIFGIFGGLLAIYIMKRFKVLNSKNIYFNIIFFISLTMMLGSTWEILEYFDDKLFIANDQRLGTGVNDTMLDLIYTLIGSIFFSIIYYIEITFNKLFFIKKYIKNI